MLIINALKTLCDFLLYFSFAALFTAYTDAWLVIGAVLALAFISSLLLQKSKGSTLPKIFCGLLPALGLFAAQSTAEILFTAVILAFYLVLTMTGKNDIHYEDYKYWFGIPAVPAIVIFMICLTKWPIRRATVVCAASYLFLGILVLRRKRIGAGADLKLRLMNLTELVGGLLLGLLACFLLHTIIIHSGKVFEILMLPFAYLLHAFIYVFTLFGNLIGANQPEESISSESEREILDSAPEAETFLNDPSVDAAYDKATVVVQVLVVILTLAILAYFLYRFYKMLRNTRLDDAGAGTTIEGGRQGPLWFGRNRRIKRKKALTLSNNEQVRRIYKDYLFLIKSRGVEITRQTTSEEAMIASGALVTSEDAAQLRALYIRARYHDAEQLSDAEVEEAKTLFNTIQEHLEILKNKDPGVL